MTVNNDEFSCKDMYLAASLLNEGVIFVRAETDDHDPKKKIFIFKRDDTIERVKEQRANGTFVVSATQYESSLRTIKSIIYSQ